MCLLHALLCGNDYTESTVLKISARPWTLTSKTGVGPAGFPSLPYINFGKIVLRSGKFQILFWRLNQLKYSCGHVAFTWTAAWQNPINYFTLVGIHRISSSIGEIDIAASSAANWLQDPICCCWAVWYKTKFGSQNLATKFGSQKIWYPFVHGYQNW